MEPLLFRWTDSHSHSTAHHILRGATAAAATDKRLLFLNGWCWSRNIPFRVPTQLTVSWFNGSEFRLGSPSEEDRAEEKRNSKSISVSICIIFSPKLIHANTKHEAAKWNHFRVRNPRVPTFNLWDWDESINGPGEWDRERQRYLLATCKCSFLLFMFLFADDAEIVNGRSGATGINNFHPFHPSQDFLWA